MPDTPKPPEGGAPPADAQTPGETGETANQAFLRRAKDQIAGFGKRAVEGVLAAVGAEGASTGGLFGPSQEGLTLAGTRDIPSDITRIRPREDLEKLPRIERIPDLRLSFTRIQTGSGSEIDRVLQKSHDEVVGAIQQTYDVLKDRVYGVQKSLTILDRNVRIVDTRTKSFQSSTERTLEKLQFDLDKLRRQPTGPDRLTTTGLAGEREKKDDATPAGPGIADFWKALPSGVSATAVLGGLSALLNAGVVGGLAALYLGYKQGWLKPTSPAEAKTRLEDNKRRLAEIDRQAEAIRREPDQARKQKMLRDFLEKYPDQMWLPMDWATIKGRVTQPPPKWNIPPGQGPTGLLEDIGSLFGMGSAKAAERPGGAQKAAPGKVAVEQVQIDLTAKESILLKGTKEVSIRAPRITIEASDIILKGRITGLPTGATGAGPGRETGPQGWAGAAEPGWRTGGDWIGASQQTGWQGGGNWIGARPFGETLRTGQPRPLAQPSGGWIGAPGRTMGAPRVGAAPRTPGVPAMAAYGMSPRGGGGGAAWPGGRVAGGPGSTVVGRSAARAPVTGDLGRYLKQQMARGEIDPNDPLAQTQAGVENLRQAMQRDQPTLLGPGAPGVPEPPGAFGLLQGGWGALTGAAASVGAAVGGWIGAGGTGGGDYSGSGYSGSGTGVGGAPSAPAAPAAPAPPPKTAEQQRIERKFIDTGQISVDEAKTLWGTRPDGRVNAPTGVNVPPPQPGAPAGPAMDKVRKFVEPPAAGPTPTQEAIPGGALAPRRREEWQPTPKTPELRAQVVPPSRREEWQPGAQTPEMKARVEPYPIPEPRKREGFQPTPVTPELKARVEAYPVPTTGRPEPRRRDEFAPTPVTPEMKARVEPYPVPTAGRPEPTRRDEWQPTPEAPGVTTRVEPYPVPTAGRPAEVAAAAPPAAAPAPGGKPSILRQTPAPPGVIPPPMVTGGQTPEERAALLGVKSPMAIRREAGAYPGAPTVAAGGIEPGAGIFAGETGKRRPGENVQTAMERAAKDLGVDPRIIWGKASVESGYQAGAAAGISSATGLGQILKGTWKEIAAYPEAAKYGITGELDERLDPYKSAVASMLYSKHNIEKLKGQGLITDDMLKKNPGLYYIPHNLGPDGAARFLRGLKENPNASVSDYLTATEIKNNPSIYTRAGQTLTVQEALGNIESGAFGQGVRLRQKLAEEGTLPMPTGGAAVAAGGAGTAPGAAATAATGAPGAPRGPEDSGVTKAVDIDKIIYDVSVGKIQPTDAAVDIAMTQAGLHEVKDRETLKAYLKDGGKSFVEQGGDPKNTAWCAAFVNSSLARAGIKGIDQATASSFRTWGNAVTDPSTIKRGDVVIVNKGARPGEPGEHVMMATGPATQDANGNWTIPTIGGNEGHLPTDPKGSSTLVTVGQCDWRNVVVRSATPEDIQMAQATPVDLKTGEAKPPGAGIDWTPSKPAAGAEPPAATPAAKPAEGEPPAATPAPAAGAEPPAATPAPAAGAEPPAATPAGAEPPAPTAGAEPTGEEIGGYLKQKHAEAEKATAGTTQASRTEGLPQYAMTGGEVEQLKAAQAISRRKSGAYPGAQPVATPAPTTAAAEPAPTTATDARRAAGAYPGAKPVATPAPTSPKSDVILTPELRKEMGPALPVEGGRSGEQVPQKKVPSDPEQQEQKGSVMKKKEHSSPRAQEWAPKKPGGYEKKSHSQSSQHHASNEGQSSGPGNRGKEGGGGGQSPDRCHFCDP